MGRLDKQFPGWILTSADEGSAHGSGSLHYNGDAIDIRKYWIRHNGDTAKVFPVDFDKLRICAGPGYDVVDETTHYHIEWDPKV